MFSDISVAKKKKKKTRNIKWKLNPERYSQKKTRDQQTFPEL